MGRESGRGQPWLLLLGRPVGGPHLGRLQQATETGCQGHLEQVAMFFMAVCQGAVRPEAQPVLPSTGRTVPLPDPFT